MSVSRSSQAMSLTVSVCDGMNTLYLLIEETEIVRLVSLEEHIRSILRARLNGKLV